jgi:CheY-like chemotaxis protein
MVDDEPAVRVITLIGLRSAQFALFCAASGREAVEILQANRAAITAALIDRNMPGLDGLATREALLQIKPALACCIISGSGEFDREELAALGVVHVLSKPYQLADLPALIWRLHEETLAAEGRDR